MSSASCNSCGRLQQQRSGKCFSQQRQPLARVRVSQAGPPCRVSTMGPLSSRVAISLLPLQQLVHAPLPNRLGQLVLEYAIVITPFLSGGRACQARPCLVLAIAAQVAVAQLAVVAQGQLAQELVIHSQLRAGFTAQLAQVLVFGGLFFRQGKPVLPAFEQVFKFIISAGQSLAQGLDSIDSSFHFIPLSQWGGAFAPPLFVLT